MSQFWQYIDATGGYFLQADGATLFVNSRFSGASMVYSKRKNDEFWTYSITVSGGERWKSTDDGLVFENVGKVAAARKFLEFAAEFRAEGLPRCELDIAERTLRIAEERAGRMPFQH